LKIPIPTGPEAIVGRRQGIRVSPVGYDLSGSVGAFWPPARHVDSACMRALS